VIDEEEGRDEMREKTYKREKVRSRDEQEWKGGRQDCN
jgi:hypothetical protein